MKKFLLLLIVYLCSISSVQSQEVKPSANEMYKQYVKKRSTNNTVGWILLASGVTIAGASYLTYANNGFNGVWEQEGLFMAGGITAIASIPFFISATANKKKAMLILKKETTGHGSSFLTKSYPAFAVRISF